MLTAHMLFTVLLSLSPTNGDTNAKERAHHHSLVSTFSIVASDPETGESGIAVASRFFAVGSVVPWASADVGAVATQSFANTSFGWRGIELLKNGLTPEETAEVLIRHDDNPTRRQFGIVAPDGSSVTYTGENCIAWAGGRNGPHYAGAGEYSGQRGSRHRHGEDVSGNRG